MSCIMNCRYYFGDGRCAVFADHNFRSSKMYSYVGSNSIMSNFIIVIKSLLLFCTGTLAVFG